MSMFDHVVIPTLDSAYRINYNPCSRLPVWEDFRHMVKADGNVLCNMEAYFELVREESTIC